MDTKTGLNQYYFPIESINMSGHKMTFIFKDNAKHLSSGKELDLKNRWTQRPGVEKINGKTLDSICKIETNTLKCNGCSYKLVTQKDYRLVYGNY